MVICIIFDDIDRIDVNSSFQRSKGQSPNLEDADVTVLTFICLTVVFQTFN